MTSSFLSKTAMFGLNTKPASSVSTPLTKTEWIFEAPGIRTIGAMSGLTGFLTTKRNLYCLYSRFVHSTYAVTCVLSNTIRSTPAAGAASVGDTEADGDEDVASSGGFFGNIVASAANRTITPATMKKTFDPSNRF